MNVLFDTNVVLDVLLDRAPHADTAAKLFALVDNGRLDGSICSTTVTTIYYIAARSFGRQGAREQVRRLLGLFRVAHVDRAALDGALYLDLPDYEDAVVHEAARGTGAEAIVTRDRAGFAHAEIPAIDPEELLTVIAVQGRD
ncbi:MAG: PIN domain-containing protein [Actinobacteria bacterium]|nr:PIN domain-containing protein [Actinomycetota bacterium]